MNDNGLLYEKILIYLKDKISKKELMPGDRLPTEMELAQEFGVSRITSKRALEELRMDGLIYRVRGRGSFVAESSRQEAAAKQAAAGLDYSKVVALVIPFGSANGGIMETIKGASAVMEEKGYLLDIKYSNNDTEEEKMILESLYEKGVGGIIFYPISDRKNVELVSVLSLNEFPIVTIDRNYEGMPVSYVVSDNRVGEYEAVKYLLELGHKKIAFITDNKIEDVTSVRNRYFGYCKALKEYGIPVRLEFVRNGEFHELLRERSIGILQELLDAGVTAVCCLNDYLANHVLQCLIAMEVKVPENLSVIGFDNLDISRVAYVPLTTVSQDREKMGEQAARYIIECIESGKYNYMQKVLPVQMVYRESCIRKG